MATKAIKDWPDLMTVGQVAAYLQLNKLTIYRYVREGRIPAAKLGKAYRIRRADVEQFIDSQKLRPEPSGTRLRPAMTGARASRQSISPAKYSDEIAVAPQRPERPEGRDRAEVDLNPMEWVIRGLH